MQNKFFDSHLILKYSGKPAFVYQILNSVAILKTTLSEPVAEELINIRLARD
jgi:hypothetical protein